MNNHPGPDPYGNSRPGDTVRLGDGSPVDPRWDAPAAADLDANAPHLRSEEDQRLNRKALLFLAGIVALLMTMAVWMLARATSPDSTSARPREETVVIPELPRAATAMPAIEPALVQPVPLVQAQPPLPPLPSEATQSQYAARPYSPPAARRSSLVERRMSNATTVTQAPGPSDDSYVQAMLAGLQAPAATSPQDAFAPMRTSGTSATFIRRPDTLMVRGTYLRCVLETRIVTDVPGFTSCITTEPVYSINGRSLLLPRGSKLLGQYGMDDVARDRVAVVWDRITTPTGLDVSMASPGVDGLGGSGHPGERDAHWGSRLGSALLISLISDVFKYAGERNGPRTTTTYGNGFVVEQPFDSNTARSVQRLAEQAIADSANRRPTVTLHQGTVVNVYVSRDVDFSEVIGSP